MGLFIIDFDFTMLAGHTHNTIARANTHDENRQWELIKSFPQICYRDDNVTITWKDIIEKMSAQGHQVAIASFSQYPHIIRRYLQEVVGLTQKMIDDIFIEAWLPYEMPRDKNHHIMNIINHIEYKNIPASIVLIDDSEPNINAALGSQMSVVKATPDGKHLFYLNNQVLPMLTKGTKLNKQFLSKQKRNPHGINFGDEVEEDILIDFKDKGTMKLSTGSSFPFFPKIVEIKEEKLEKKEKKTHKHCTIV